MEASTLFTVGSYLGLSTGAVFLSVWNQERHAAGLDADEAEQHDTEAAICTAIEAIRLLIDKQDK